LADELIVALVDTPFIYAARMLAAARGSAETPRTHR
jgi:hypothetical protein